MNGRESAGEHPGRVRRVSDYRDQPAIRNGFHQLADTVFGVDFRSWQQHGFWDDRFTCFSFMNGDEMIANVSVSRMELVADGVGTKALQFGAVATHPDYRRQGWSGRLMQSVLDEYDREYGTMFLFANKSVVDFYPKFGFRRVSECGFVCDAAAWIGAGAYAPARGTVRQLDMANPADVRLAAAIVDERAPVSQRAGVHNGTGITMWHLLYSFPEHLHYFEEENGIVIAERKGNALCLYDIVASREVRMNRLAQLAVSAHGAERVVFCFTPDCLNVAARPFDDPSETILFVRGDWPFPAGPWKFPATAQT